MVEASKSHVLHFSLSVFPVNIFGVVYGLNVLINQNFIDKMNIFDRHNCDGRPLQWLSVKLPEMNTLG